MGRLACPVVACGDGSGRDEQNTDQKRCRHCVSRSAQRDYKKISGVATLLVRTSEVHKCIVGRHGWSIYARRPVKCNPTQMQYSQGRKLRRMEYSLTVSRKKIMKHNERVCESPIARWDGCNVSASIYVL
jgi:hypothetical protein